MKKSEDDALVVVAGVLFGMWIVREFMLKKKKSVDIPVAFYRAFEE